MKIKWLIKELQKANPEDEAILIVEEIGEANSLRGVICKVIRSGEGARNGQTEIYAKG
jgi:hypothetical protein